MSIPKKKGLVPVLRFPEFRDSGEWEVKKIGEISKVSAGATPSTDNPEYWNGDIPWMNSGELNQKRIYSVGNRITSLGLKESSTKLVPPGCILIGLAGQGKTRGTAAINYIELCTNQSIASILPNNRKFNSEFLFHKIDYMYNHLRSLSKGEGGRGGLNLQIIKSVDIPLPNLKEQQKIAESLFSIDELVTAQTQKVEALKTHKNGLMQQLFPSEGETAPKRRFPEFRDAGNWQVKKIGQVLIVDARPIKMNNEQDYSLVTVKRRYGGVVSRGTFKGGSIKVKSQFLLEDNDFLISKRQIVHCACGLVPAEFEGSIVSNEYSVLRARKNNDILFFNYFAQQPKVSQSFLECSIGIVIEKMLFKLNDWLKQEFLFPSFEEQQKIAACLSSVDDLITAQTQKLAALKAHKKGLMQLLFPAFDGVAG